MCRLFQGGAHLNTQQKTINAHYPPNGAEMIRGLRIKIAETSNPFRTMTVVPLTLTISLCLVFTFIVFFLREQARGNLSSAERDSLLPLAEEKAVFARRVARADAPAPQPQLRK